MKRLPNFIKLEIWGNGAKPNVSSPGVVSQLVSGWSVIKFAHLFLMWNVVGAKGLVLKMLSTFGHIPHSVNIPATFTASISVGSIVICCTIIDIINICKEASCTYLMLNLYYE